MPGASEKLRAAVEAYFDELGKVRPSGGGTGELSYYPALEKLLRAVGGSLKPRVFPVSNLAERAEAPRLRPHGRRGPHRVADVSLADLPKAATQLANHAKSSSAESFQQPARTLDGSAAFTRRKSLAPPPGMPTR